MRSQTNIKTSKSTTELTLTVANVVKRKKPNQPHSSIDKFAHLHRERVQLVVVPDRTLAFDALLELELFSQMIEVFLDCFFCLSPFGLLQFIVFVPTMSSTLIVLQFFFFRASIVRVNVSDL